MGAYSWCNARPRYLLLFAPRPAFHEAYRSRSPYVRCMFFLLERHLSTFIAKWDWYSTRATATVVVSGTVTDTTTGRPTFWGLWGQLKSQSSGQHVAATKAF